MSPTTSAPAAVTGLIVRESRQSIPLERVSVEAHVTDLTARVTVRQSYRNREKVPLEVVYVFPLDEGAAVCGFEATVDGVRYVGEVKEREEAFKDYDDAMEAGHGAFLLDEERADIFTASLGNVMPGSQVELSITYVTELAAEGPGARFTLPTTVSPRYAPDADRTGVGPVPADTLNPPVQLDVPYAFTFDMHATMNGVLRMVTSPSYPVEVQQDGKRAHVRLAQRSAPMDRDLVIVLAAEGLDAPHAIVERPDVAPKPGGNRAESTQGGAVLISFLPKFEAGQQPAEVVFVIDRSGSMGGKSIAEVRNALQLCLRSLTSGCRFNIVSFGSEYSALFPESRDYSDESLKAASSFVSTIAADMGGTELLPALEFVVRQPRAEGLARQILVLTDGEVTNTDAVIHLAKTHAGRARFFTFGIGAGASQHLVRGIARASGGAAEFIHPGERIEAKVMRQFKRVFALGLTDVAVDWGRTGVTPASDQIPPVFDGERLLVYALGGVLKAGVVKLTGMLAGRPATFDVAVDPDQAVAGTTVATLAARTRIRVLEEEPGYLGSRGSRQGRVRRSKAAEEIAKLGVQYQLCSRETSFVAIEHRETPSSERAELRRVPVALTSGWGGVQSGHDTSQGLLMAAAALQTDSVQYLMRVSRSSSESRTGEFDIGAALAPPAPSRLGRLFRLDRERARQPRRHDALVALQTADGSWDLTRHFANAIARDLGELQEAFKATTDGTLLARRAFATSVALAWLVECALDAEDEWRMLAEKALTWLAKCGTTPAGNLDWRELGMRVVRGQQFD